MIIKEITHKWMFDSQQDYEKFNSFVSKVDDKTLSVIMTYCLNSYFKENGFDNLIFNGMSEIFEDSTELPVKTPKEVPSSDLAIRDQPIDELRYVVSVVNELKELMKNGAVNLSNTVNNANVNKIVHPEPTPIKASVGEIVDVEVVTPVVTQPAKKKKKKIDIGALGERMARMSNK